MPLLAILQHDEHGALRGGLGDLTDRPVQALSDLSLVDEARYVFVGHHGVHAEDDAATLGLRHLSALPAATAPRSSALRTSQRPGSDALRVCEFIEFATEHP